MGQRMRGLVAGLALCATLAMPVGAASGTVEVNGEPLSTTEGWIENGVSYLTLAGLSRVAPAYTLGWDGRSALLDGGGASLTATQGEAYVLVNDRALYLPQGVSVVDGRTALPTVLVADALGGAVAWDGVTNTVSMTTGDAPYGADSYDASELYWLSRVISSESRGESLTGQIAVGNVVLNRVDHWRYPSTIYGVVFDRNFGVQFEPVSNGTIFDNPTDKSVIAAKLSLEGADIVGDSLYFFAPALSEGTWIVNNCWYQMTIGCHAFYTDYAKFI